MKQDDILKKMSQIGSVKIFQEQDYICYEGQPGTVMYIIFKGTVGVYVGSASGQQVEVCRLGPDDFFGEMALLDNQPRSASCVALNRVVCAEISRDKLQEFIALCPAIAMKILESLSLRIRKLSNDLYKTSSSSSADAEFVIPGEYIGGHPLKEPVYKKQHLKSISGICPICGKEVSVANVERLNIAAAATDKNGRPYYNECDPLWVSIWNCPHCRYSNFYSRFFAVTEDEAAAIRQLLEEQQLPAINGRPDLTTSFDQLFILYLQAIHINQRSGSRLLTGRLWLNLYWLFDDARDTVMKKYCAERSAAALSAALAANEVSDQESRLVLLLSLTDMYAFLGDKDSAAASCSEILACTGHIRIRNLANELKAQYKL